MKSIKMIFLMAIIGMIISTSCSTEKEELTEVKKEHFKLNKSNELLAIEDVIHDISVESKPSVDWCPSHGNPHKIKDGFGIAKVTVTNGSIHYVAAYWESNGTYEVHYIGDSLPSGWVC